MVRILLSGLIMRSAYNFFHKSCTSEMAKLYKYHHDTASSFQASKVCQFSYKLLKSFGYSSISKMRNIYTLVHYYAYNSVYFKEAFKIPWLISNSEIYKDSTIILRM